MATRTEVRDYYRKSIGIASIVNALWMLCSAGLAIYISDYGELNPETNEKISELVLYGYYATFFIGAFMVLILFIAGIVALKSNSESIFKMLMSVSVVTGVLGAIFSYSSAYSLWWAGVEWSDTYSKTIIIISLILGILTVVYSVFTVIMAFLGKKYYDNGRKEAKEAVDIKKQRLDVKFTGYTMVSYILIALAVYGLSLYFKNDIIEFDRIQGADNAKYIGLFNRVFIAGMVMSFIHAVMTVLVFVKGTNTIMYANKIIMMGQCAVTAFYILVSATALDMEFSKRGYADASYIVFSYILIAMNLAIAIRTFKMKISD